MNFKGGLGGSLISSCYATYICTNHTNPSYKHNLMIFHNNHSILLHRPWLLVQNFILERENQSESCTVGNQVSHRFIW